MTNPMPDSSPEQGRWEYSETYAAFYRDRHVHVEESEVARYLNALESDLTALRARLEAAEAYKALATERKPTKEKLANGHIWHADGSYVTWTHEPDAECPRCDWLARYNALEKPAGGIAV